MGRVWLRDVAENCLDQPDRDMPVGTSLRLATMEDVRTLAGIIDRESQGRCIRSRFPWLPRDSMTPCWTTNLARAVRS